MGWACASIFREVVFVYSVYSTVHCIVVFQNTGTLDVVRLSIRLYHEGPQNKTLSAYQFQKYHYNS